MDLGGFSISGSSIHLPQISGMKASTLHPDHKTQKALITRATPTQSAVVPIRSALSADLPKQKSMKPSAMQRAKTWTLEVENAYRYQLAGFKDESDYLLTYPLPEMWSAGGMIKCLTVKETGYFMYFRQIRECEDKHLNKVKLFQY